MLNTSNMRAVAWLTEFRVVLELARHDNEWAYVGRIVSWQPKVTSLNREGHDHLTKPGARSACRRLADPEIGILEVKLARTPKKKEETPHYRIVPTLDGLSRIFRVLGPGVLSTIAQTWWGQGTITKDLVRYMTSGFGLKEDITPVVNPIRLREIEYMARQSSKALEVLLGPLQFDVPMGKDSDRNLQLSVDRLRDVMHLAWAVDIVSAPRKNLEEQEWTGEIELNSHLRFGNLGIMLKTRFPTPDEVKNIPKGDGHVAEEQIPAT